MKKVALALIALIAIFVIYYITIGSKQLTAEIRKEVNKEFTQLKGSGFSIDEQNLSNDRQKIILTLQDTDKITAYLNKQEQHLLNRDDIEILKGMQIALDIEYNPNTSDAIAMDIYPIKLPNNFYQNLNKKDIAKLEELIKEKLFLVHININKLLSSFNGYIKDIDKEFKDDGTTSHLVMKGAKFDGTIEDNNIEDIKQTLEKFSFEVNKQININLNGLITNIKNHDNNLHDVEYSIKSFNIINKIENPFTLKIANITGISEERLNKNLLNQKSKDQISSIEFTQNGKKTILNSINIDTSVHNINQKAFDKLRKKTPENIGNSEGIQLLKELIKDNISIEIPNLSIDKITYEGKTFDGFKIKALAKVEKDFDLKSLDNNLQLALTKLFNVKINIEASNEFINLISNNPQIMVMMMIIQPIDKNGKKYYDIQYNKGELKINGKPFM